jgi:hypothetical protein
MPKTTPPAERFGRRRVEPLSGPLHGEAPSPKLTFAHGRGSALHLEAHKPLAERSHPFWLGG